MPSIQLLLSERNKGTFCLAVLLLVVGALAFSMLGVQKIHQNIRGFVGHNDNSPSTTEPSVFAGAHFVIVDYNAVVVVPHLSNGTAIDIQAIGGDLETMDIHVQTSPVACPIDFIEFSHNGVENISRSFTKPYSICRGMPHHFCLDLFAVGEHTITAAGYTNAGGKVADSLPSAYVVVGPADGPSMNVSAVAVPPVVTKNPVEDEAVERGLDQLLDDWEWGVNQYPLSVAEAQGARIGDDLVVIGGFIDGFSETTRQTYALNLTDVEAGWHRMDDMPTAIGITHAGYAVVGELLFMCGGYVGGNIGRETDICMRYNHTAPSGRQWRFIRPLPEGRAGGGMVYDSNQRVLLFSAGATRPQAGVAMANDHANSWMYNLSYPLRGWVPSTDIPYHGNHLGFVTARDQYNRERHFFVGGQMGEDEFAGNTKENYEWIATNYTWVARRSMPLSRGHAASSTKALGCGFLVIGGTTNEHGMTSDISFYDIPSNSWKSVGSLPAAVNTAVCESGGGYLFCETGWADGHFSVRRKMVLSSE